MAKAKKATKKSASKRSKSAAKKSAVSTKGPKKGSTRKVYSEVLKLKVVKAIRKGMTHLEASKAFEVGVHSIPNWLRKHA